MPICPSCDDIEMNESLSGACCSNCGYTEEY